MIEEAFLLSFFKDRSFATIRIIKGGVRDFRGCQLFLISYRFLSLFRMRDINLDSLGGVMLVGFADEKTGECVVCCHRWGTFLMKSASTTSYMICLECGTRLVVCVKKGKVSVFDDTRSEEELAILKRACKTEANLKFVYTYQEI